MTLAYLEMALRIILMKLKINRLPMKTVYQFVLLTFVSFLTSCLPDTYEFGELTAPTNLQVNVEIVGATAASPLGDGSGKVVVTAKAENAISYKFIYNGEESVVPSGTKTYVFGKTGTHFYTLQVIAIGRAGAMTVSQKQFEVFASYQPPADLLKMLTNDSQRKWRVHAEIGGHFGVGPGDATSPIWYAANANDKAGTGMYDDIYTFVSDGTFTHTTNGNVLGKQKYLADFNPAIATEADNDFENFPLANYNANWSLSAPGGVETITLTNKGFLGFYVGTSSYQILSRNANSMVLKTVDSLGRAWFITLIAV